MSKRVKIHKKKSFMFTTKHHSFLGWLGGIIGITSVIIIGFLVYKTFGTAGKAPVKYGGVGIGVILLNIIGVISGLLGTKERDAYKFMSIFGVIINTILIVFWILLLVVSH